ncbi:copper resistance protein B [Microbulbifer sp. CnH-101-E]|uniref:copper resistance protein B n=1 Tax=unclassified Microbulbifer TaxID=2619833 RepID=UPI00403A3CFB
MKRFLLVSALISYGASTQGQTIYESDLNLVDIPDHVMDHEKLFTMGKLDQLELRGSESDALTGDLWFGGIQNKLWLKGAWEREDGETENAELQALYSRAMTPLLDLQLGLRHDFRLEDGPSKNWAAVGLQALAPYFFEVDATMFIGEGGDSAIRLEAEYELLFTQKLILTPKVELDFYGQNDPANNTGTGLSDIEAGLRFRYEFTRQLAPYIGVHYERKYGNAADFAQINNEEISSLNWVVGIRAWF